VLVTIDTLRADHLQGYGYVRQTSPFLDRLAGAGVLFEHATATISHTAPSHSSILTGLLPLQHRVLRNGDKLSRDIPSVAQAYRRAGYATAAFLSTGFLAWTATSFETVDADLREGGRTVERALAWVEQNGGAGPFLLWVHLFDVHEAEIAGKAPPKTSFDAIRRRTPLAPSAFFDYLADLHGLPETSSDAPFRGLRWEANENLRRGFLATPSDFVESIDHYDAQIDYVDGLIERLFRAVVGQDDTNSLWVITSDHGEGLGSHGYRGHDGHIYQAQLHVPLIFWASDDSLVPRRVSTRVSLVDLFPTLVTPLGGLDPDAPPVEGVSLWPALSGRGSLPADRAVFAQKKPMPTLKNTMHALLRGPRKYILHTDPDRQHEYYDLDTDPRELVNRIGATSVEGYRAELEARLEELAANPAAPRGDETDVPDAMLEELEALGYLGDDAPE
jgi:arylsulfatase A-like enzyme